MHVTRRLWRLQATNMAAQMHCEKANTDIHQRQAFVEALCKLSLPEACGQLARHSVALRPLLETAPSALLAVPPTLLPEVAQKQAQRRLSLAARETCLHYLSLS